ncbi:hypothetical protein COCNU_13G006750 [Cocos nucifera]|uniref:Uncharacterized protein n=1 Tax=Cocos nucifera TaxID=13894 RepID=A0A8K0NC95_COCNU|nr:hypothetical protein COCNU_13G006750 [Cocos nucifera]
MEEYKSFENFTDEVMEALGEAFNNGFASCKDLIGKLFPSLDLSGVTQKVGLALASRKEIPAALEVSPLVEMPQPIPELPVALIQPKVEALEVPALDPTEAPTPILASAEVAGPVEVISLQEDSAATIAKAPQANA